MRRLLGYLIGAFVLPFLCWIALAEDYFAGERMVYECFDTDFWPWQENFWG